MKIRGWKDFLDVDLPSPGPITEETREETLREASRFRGSMRVSTGLFWTDEEFERVVSAFSRHHFHNHDESESSPMDSSDDFWRKIIAIHNHTKSLMILAEEVERGSRTFIQPILEWRSALEHIVRARAEEMRIRNPNAAPDGEYVRANLDKALGHEYRAFFDTADWLGAIIRERVIDSVGPYSVECITQVMPDYYKTIRPELERANREIAEIRERKDIAHGDMLMEQVENYTAVLEKLLARHKEMLATIPSFEECSKKLRRSGFCKRAWDIVVGIIAGAFVGYLLSRFPSASGKASP